MLLVVWRVSEAIRALPDSPDHRTEMRWNHGVARELVRMQRSVASRPADIAQQWSAIAALGIEAAASVTTFQRTDRQLPPGLSTLLDVSTWNGDLSLSFNVAGLDRAAFLHNAPHDAVELDRLDQARAADRWWMWGAESPSDRPRPSWWIVPLACVVREASDDGGLR